jgi:hypothetical protein
MRRRMASVVQTRKQAYQPSGARGRRLKSMRAESVGNRYERLPVSFTSEFSADSIRLSREEATG